ncbi:GRAM domain-containing protein [Russula aff. rugulosa BPL654]|nr:GRAM domain-containing protein [Russula aff. rugulosa BPL654]
MRSHHDSLSSRSQEQDGYGSSADGQDEDADDDSDDDALLAELNDGDIPVTGFAVASNKRNADFHELFRTIPEGDYLIEDYGCALQREILVQGRIYISENHICFYANIFGWITNLVVPIYEIVSLEKKMTAFVIPNAIQITTRTTKYSFASFLARDTAHDVIYNIWRLARPEDGFSEDETSGRPALDASHALRITSPSESGAIPIGSMAPLTHKATTCACGREGKHYSEIAIDTVIPGTPERIYNLMFASGFLKDFMRDNQKLEDIQISDWAPMPTDQNCLARNMSYIKRLNGSIGPKSAKCEIRDETLYCDFDDYVATLTTTRTPDVPSGGAFSVKTRTCITWASSASSRIVVSSQVEWTGRSFIKGIIEKSAIEGQRTYQRELDRAMRVYIQEHQTEFIPAGLDPASVVVAVEGDTAVPTTATGPAPQNEEAARKEREKEREQERNQRSIQWAYDTFEGAMSVGRQSASVAIELIRDAWDQSSTSTILYFAIALLVLSNLWTLVLVGQREEAGRRKEVRRTEEREKWVQGIVTALWEELAAGRQPGTSLPSSPQQQQQQQHQSVPVNVQLPESWREEVAEIMGALDAVEERVQLIRRSLADLD